MFDSLAAAFEISEEIFLESEISINFPKFFQESPIHRALFWVAVSVLQLDEITLYAAGLALLEQNLHTLNSQGIFDKQQLVDVMMGTREPLEWHFKQLDHAVGLSFKSNFHFALVGHLLKVRNFNNF